MIKYAHGAYGSNNNGDNAIFEGMRKEIPNIKQLYLNKTLEPKSLCYGDIIDGRTEFDNEANELIIGGGGLLYHKGAVETHIKLAEIAISNGMRVSIQGLGCEDIKPEYYNEVQKLASLASYISVRSKRSQELLSSLNIRSNLRKDFAYNLEGFKLTDIKIPENKRKGVLNIGLTTNTIVGENFDKLCAIIRELLWDVNIYHIPHSKAYVSIDNNDIITGNKLWSSIDVYHSDRENWFTLLPYYNVPNNVLTMYSQLDAIIGFRYHSFIFAELNNKPCFGFTTGDKFETYFKEKNSNSYIDFNEPFDIILDKTRAFIKSIKE